MLFPRSFADMNAGSSEASHFEGVGFTAQTSKKKKGLSHFGQSAI